MNQNSKPEERTTMRPDGAGFQPPRRIDIRELLGDSRELRIVHNGQVIPPVHDRQWQADFDQVGEKHVHSEH